MFLSFILSWVFFGAAEKILREIYSQRLPNAVIA
jgi:hypothetical protein